MSIIAISWAAREWLRRPSEAAQEEQPFTAGDFLGGVFQACQRTLDQAVETMTEEDMVWRPYPETASAGYYLWHLARVQDALIHKQILNRPEIWETHGYAQQFGLPLGDTGQDYTPIQRAHFQEPPKAELLEYLRLTFTALYRMIESMAPDELDFSTEMGIQRIRYLSILTTHANLHAGAINHIRDILAASREVPTEL